MGASKATITPEEIPHLLWSPAAPPPPSTSQGKRRESAGIPGGVDSWGGGKVTFLYPHQQHVSTPAWSRVLFLSWAGQSLATYTMLPLHRLPKQPFIGEEKGTGKEGAWPRSQGHFSGVCSRGQGCAGQGGEETGWVKAQHSPAPSAASS